MAETKLQMLARLDRERAKLRDFPAILKERREELLLHIESTINCLWREYAHVEDGGDFGAYDVQRSVEWLMAKHEDVEEAQEAIDYAAHQIEDMLADLADDQLWAVSA